MHGVRFIKTMLSASNSIFGHCRQSRAEKHVLSPFVSSPSVSLPSFGGGGRGVGGAGWGAKSTAMADMEFGGFFCF